MTMEKYIKDKLELAKRIYNNPNLTEEHLIPKHSDFAKDYVMPDDVDRITHIVFAPDSTGNPTSDIQYYLSCGDDTFKEYVRSKLLVAQNGESVSDNPDDAFAVTKKNMQTFEDYAQHIHDFVMSNVQKPE